MFETTKTIIKNSTRDLFKKMKESPVLYIFFTLIMIFSVLMFAFLGFYLQVIDLPLDVRLEDVFYMVFFIFLAKSAVDVYKYFIKPGEVTYSLSTQINHRKTIFEIFFAIFLINFFIWFLLSSLFILFVLIFPINVYYPVEYLFFNLAVINALIIGSTICLNFFSDKRIRLIPTAILLLFVFFSQSPLLLVLFTPLTLLHLFWTINYSISSYQNIRRKSRLNEKAQIKIRSVIKALFFKETTILWRDKLFFSFIATSVLTGFGTGYLYLYGPELLIPPSLQDLYAEFLPALFIIMGIVIVVIYTSVFPSLNLFLNEEKTMWIIRHIPISSSTLIYGKISTLILCFVCAIPFIAYISIFMGLENILFVTWLLILSYIISTSISIPLGVKYVGKKSDVMLLYSVTIILFVILAPIAVLGKFFYSNTSYPAFFLTVMILVAIIGLSLSIKISENILNLKYPKLKLK